jgi:hypothetical protein
VASETTRRGGITKWGRKRLRTVCIQAVLAMVNRTDTPLMEFYQKKKREKGAGKAICATVRKLLTIIFVLLKKELDYWYLEDRLYNRKLRRSRLRLEMLTLHRNAMHPTRDTTAVMFLQRLQRAGDAKRYAAIFFGEK